MRPVRLTVIVVAALGLTWGMVGGLIPALGIRTGASINAQENCVPFDADPTPVIDFRRLAGPPERLAVTPETETVREDGPSLFEFTLDPNTPESNLFVSGCEFQEDLALAITEGSVELTLFEGETYLTFPGGNLLPADQCDPNVEGLGENTCLLAPNSSTPVILEAGDSVFHVAGSRYQYVAPAASSAAGNVRAAPAALQGQGSKILVAASGSSPLRCNGTCK